MAWLKQLQFSGLRNFSSTASLFDLPKYTVICGNNGAGKTTVLEAVYILGMARSFRSQKLNSLINHDGQALSVEGQLGLQHHSTASRPVSVLKSRMSPPAITSHGRRCRSASELAQSFPLQLINSHTFGLVEGAPGLRRQFVDWGVFHVEHGFFDDWRRCQRLLKQRNSLLRRGKIASDQVDAWDVEYVRLVDRITQKRRAFITALQPLARGVLHELWPGGIDVEMGFYPGWDERLPFSAALESQRLRDMQLGYTQYGSHRADLKLRLRGAAVSESLSRGQLKLLVVSLKIAQAVYLSEGASQSCTFLMDDLPAELDADKLQRVIRVLDDLSGQVFISCISAGELTHLGAPGRDKKMFHVEHGSVISAE